MRSHPAVRLLFAACLGLAGAGASAGPGAAQDRPPSAAPSWPTVQGGPAHLGVAEEAPPPPYRETWRTEAGASGHRGASGPVVVDDIAIALGRDEVLAVDASTGDVEWSVARSPGLPVTPAVSDDGRTLVYPEGSGDGAALTGLDLGTRTVRWRFPTAGEVRAAPTIEYNAVFVGTRNGHVHAVDVGSGRERWRFDARAAVRTAVAVADRRVYFTAEDTGSFRATLFALDERTGRERWRYSPPGANTFVSGITVTSGRIVFAMGDRLARALDAASGEEAWTAGMAAPAGSATTPAAVGDDVVIADASGTLARYDGQTGARHWRFRFPSAFVQGAPLAVGDHVVVGRHDGVIVAVDAAEGRLAWDLDLGAGPIGSLAPAGEALIAGIVGAGGGLVGLEHDPSIDLRSVESPSVLHPGAAVANYGIALAAVLGGFLLAFRLLGRSTRPGAERTATNPPAGGLR